MVTGEKYQIPSDVQRATCNSQMNGAQDMPLSTQIFLMARERITRGRG